ncbi:monovalent cation/H(+) antiporter subunit G [Alteromonas sp. ASW11-130]|uniref:monovalent cation/H(+) antiporter subunit G n=1 Tax=Alteromonas sp. ASW11-130 TaxID=3015775 RepID=UPI002241F0FE|nr:monovalent cation/H(+) antiporter subunit G [Alteromonas sp. ASW11-130]MCW8092757.1 monovalent cation/H(+) antiporter subunit G [Alteromonas sp. ASW11-130]
MIVDWISGAFLALGAFLSIIGGIGLHRMPDFYCRLHAVGVTDTLCSFLILCGLSFQAGLSLVSAKLFFIFLFLFFTSPTSSFSLGHNAWKWGLNPKGVKEHAPTVKIKVTE